MAARCMAAVLFALAILLAGGAAQGTALQYTWMKMTATGPAISSCNQVAVVYQNKLWVLSHNAAVVGPIAANHFSVWNSADGVAWTKVGDVSAALSENPALVAFKSKLWIYDYDFYAWSSTDGKTWTRGTYVPWSVADYRLNFVIHNNRLYCYGANGGMAMLRVSDDGNTWSVARQASVPVYNRANPALASFLGQLWVMGGANGTTSLNDIWGSADSQTWTRYATAAAWPARSSGVAAVYDGKLWLVGGKAGTQTLSDIWYSYNGAQWIKFADTLPWGAPSARSQLTVFGSGLWLVGGGTTAREVWRYDYPYGTPVIAPIAAATAQEKIAYIGPEPLLTQGTLPVNWSLAAGPAGMTVNAATGVVTWPAPVLSATPYTVTLRATNSVGAGTVSWQVRVNPQTPATITVPRYCRPEKCVVSWSDVPTIGSYTLQYDDAPDFASPLGTMTLSTLAHNYTFNTLPADKTYWFRVRGNKLGGLTSVWSAVTTSTLDVTPPAGTIQINDGAPVTHLSLVKLSFTWHDDGRQPSGVYQLRLSEDNSTWDVWRPLNSTMMFSLSVGYSLAGQYVYVQYRDRTGNVSPSAQAVIQVAAPLVTPIFVDTANTAGPWLGTALYPHKRIADALFSGATLYVAQGTYAESISMPNGARIYGGFPRGFDYTKRDPVKYASTITPPGSLSSTQRTGVKMISVQNAVVDGFRITGCGLKDYFKTSDAWGAGVFCQSVGRDCTIANCTITNNTARNTSTTLALKGGGIYLYNSTPVISHCVITNNIANDGGGIYAFYGANAQIDGCLIKDNHAVTITTAGGGGHGGGLYAEQSNLLMQNCILSGNGPDGILADVGAAQLYNCTLSNNGITNSRGSIYNCIVWGGALVGTAAPNYSCVQNWTGGGMRNLTVDPQFVNAAGGDFHLKATSPCIDAGGRLPTVTVDYDGRTRPISVVTTARGDGSHYDMGAFEYKP